MDGLKGIANDRHIPTPHQTGRTDFPYPAFRAASSQAFGCAMMTTSTGQWWAFATDPSVRVVVDQGILSTVRDVRGACATTSVAFGCASIGAACQTRADFGRSGSTHSSHARYG